MVLTYGFNVKRKKGTLLSMEKCRKKLLGLYYVLYSEETQVSRVAPSPELEVCFENTTG
jgi:hypothetical protein